MKVSDDQVLPVMTDLLAVPECLTLSSTYRQFQSIIGLCQRDVNLLPCRKRTLECSLACGQCRGNACTNSTHQFDYRDLDLTWALEKPK